MFCLRRRGNSISRIRLKIMWGVQDPEEAIVKQAKDDPKELELVAVEPVEGS